MGMGEVGEADTGRRMRGVGVGKAKDRWGGEGEVGEADTGRRISRVGMGEAKERWRRRTPGGK